MMSEATKDITVTEKKEVETQSEPTVPIKRYLPLTDIVETEKDLLIYMDMPGVRKDKVNIRLEKNVLTIGGEIDSTPYADIKPLYTEYNIGHFNRNFELSNEIDQSGISASMSDGVLTVTLPKEPQKQPKLIQVS
jgi:HSP20 family protein